VHSCTTLSMSTFSEHSEFSFTDFCFFYIYMSTTACNSLSGMFLASRMLNSICVCTLSKAFS
jgi:hypothetical protein